MTTPSEAFAELKGRLDVLEWAFFEITGRDLIIERPGNGDKRFVFEDRTAFITLSAAQDYAQTCVSNATTAMKNAAAAR